MLDATVQNLVTWATGHLGFMHPWIRQYQGKSIFSYVKHWLCSKQPELFCMCNSVSEKRTLME